MKHIFIIIAALYGAISAQNANAQCSGHSTLIYFLGGFEHDQVKFVVNGRTVFNKVVTSNSSSGYADSFSLSRNATKQRLVLIVNGVTLNTTWLDHKNMCLLAFGYSKIGYFIKTEEFIDKLPMLN